MATVKRQETSLIRVVSFDFAGFDVVDPAMDEQMTVRHARGYRRMGTQVLQLGDDVFLGEDRHAFFFVGAMTVVMHHGFRDFGVAQPGFDCRHLFQAVRVEYRTHGAAIGVAANDDVLHAQRQHRVFDRGGHAAVHLAVRRDNVADVAGHEQIARRTLGDQFGDDARVGASDKHRFGRLGRGEFLEEFFLLGKNFMMKMQKAVNDLSQRCIGGFRFRGLRRRSQRLFILVTHDSSS
ncbi:conserved hypothetical protein [Pseudomonas sp. IT-347P]